VTAQGRRLLSDPVVVVLVLTAVAALLAVGGLPWAAWAVLALTAGTDAVLTDRPRRAGRVAEVLDRAVGRSMRLALRAVVLVFAGSALLSSRVAAVLACAAVALVVLVGAVDALAWALQELRRHPVARGIPGLPAHRVGPPRPAVLLTFVPELLLGAGAALLREEPLPVAVVGLLAVGVSGGTAARWVSLARRIRGSRLTRLRAAQRALDGEAYEVVLYHGDGQNSVHEAGMWLPTLEQLPQRTLVLIRNRAAFDALPPTTTAVLCVPGAQDLMSLRLDGVRVALFVSNIGNNIHLLRVPGIRTAFIGHGDSDKSASANPYSKVYDEIWVAGPAGRQRYLRADTGVRADSLVEVGRPQLDLVRSGPLRGDGVPTLLYAPTWEGWNDEQAYSSVVTHAEALVEAVLAAPVPLRLLYRPHPYTGRRDPRAAAAHLRVVHLLEEANRRAGRSGPTVLAAGTGPVRSPSAAEAERRAVARGEELLAGVPTGTHLVVEPGTLPLISCFNVAAGLVTDVSSVLSDFLASGRPVAVCDPLGRDPEVFRSLFPAAAAGPVLPPDGTGLAELLDVLAGAAPDGMVEARAALREHLLGAPHPPAIERFSEAVTALGARARLGTG
jgi:hypothetical protein